MPTEDENLKQVRNHFFVLHMSVWYLLTTLFSGLKNVYGVLYQVFVFSFVGDAVSGSWSPNWKGKVHCLLVALNGILFFLFIFFLSLLRYYTLNGI